MKKTYGLFQQRGYRARMLAAAYRHHLHWSELIGGDLVQAIPYEWQLLFNRSDVRGEADAESGGPSIVEELHRKFADFRRAYDENGMTVEEFDRFGATAADSSHVHRLVQMELVACVRDFMLPDPDKK